MTFLHKLAQRLARLKHRAGIYAAVTLGTAVASCERPLALTDSGVTIARVVVWPKTVTLQPNQVTNFLAVAMTPAGDTVLAPVTWSVTGGSITDSATSNGLHYGHYRAAADTGRVRVVAMNQPTGKSDTATAVVTAVAVPVAAVGVLPASATVPIGGTAQLVAIPKDVAGNLLAGRTVTWASSATSVATVNSSGLVTGKAVGAAMITATSEGQSGTANVTVIVAPPPSACGNTGSGTCYYVDANVGNDANPGTSAQPFRTLQQAADVVNPGDGVLVNDGVYTGGSAVVTISRSGTAANWIVFRAVHQWGAVVDGQNNASDNGINVQANYIRVEGFEVRWVNRHGIEVFGGGDGSVATIHDVVVAQNHVHDIGHICTDDTGGRVGISPWANNIIVEQNVIHDIGRLGPGEQGCSPATTNWQNHDHGIYQGVGDNTIIRNNVFYNNTHGWSIQRYSSVGASITGWWVLNNTFVGANPNRDGQIVVAGATNGIVIANNIFYQPRTAGIYFSSPGTWAGALVENNLSTAAVSTPSVSGVTFVGSIENTDPRLVSPSTFDCHLLAGSPAIDAGMTLLNVLIDFAGVTRPQGAGYDVGAFEFK